MSIIKGDIKRALGFKEIELGELKIDISSTTAKDIVEFQELSIKAMKGKKLDDMTSEDFLQLNKITNQWYVDYFKKRDDKLTEDELELFIVKNKRSLQKEFTIGFGIKSRDDYEADEKKALEEAEKKE